MECIGYNHKQREYKKMPITWFNTNSEHLPNYQYTKQYIVNIL